MSSVFALGALATLNNEDAPVYPEVVLEVDWDNDGIFEGGNEDVTGDCRFVECWRGRDIASNLVGRSLPGHLFAIQNNDDNKYNSFNSSSALFGSLLPGRECRLVAKTPFAATLWQGFTDEIRPRISETREKRADLPARGPLARVAGQRASAAMATTIGTGAAIDDILDDAGWGTADRSIDTGELTMNRWWINSEYAINALRAIEDSEGGFIAESRDGKILFESRHHRIKNDHILSMFTFSDVAADVGVVRYQNIDQLESLPNIFNSFETRVRRFSTSATVTLWTHPDRIGSADAPTISAGETKDFWAVYPHTDAAIDVKGADSWVTPVLGTDITATSVNNPIFPDLSGNLSVSATSFGERLKITLTNNLGNLLYLNLAVRGVSIRELDPILIHEIDTTSIGKFGERHFPSKAEWVPDIEEGLRWTGYMKSIYKDPLPWIAIEFNANHDILAANAAIRLQVSDRITVKATGNSGLGINEDFFVERIERRIRPGKEFWCRLECSPADVTGGSLVLDDATLGLLDTAKVAW